jgi:MATE family multidrug resistance protein
MLAIPNALLSIYVDVSHAENAAMVALAGQFLLVAAVFQLADGLQAVAAGMLRGLQDTRVPMAIAVFGYWAIGFATAFVLGFHTRLAGQGVWIGLACGLFVVAVLLLWRWSLRNRLGLGSAGRSAMVAAH